MRSAAPLTPARGADSRTIGKIVTSRPSRFAAQGMATVSRVGEKRVSRPSSTLAPSVW